MTKITINNVQRVIAPTLGKPQLWFLCSAHRLMTVNISVKFRKISQIVFKLRSARFCDRQTDRRPWQTLYVSGPEEVDINMNVALMFRKYFIYHKYSGYITPLQYLSNN